MLAHASNINQPNYENHTIYTEKTENHMIIGNQARKIRLFMAQRLQNLHREVLGALRIAMRNLLQKQKQNLVQNNYRRLCATVKKFDIQNLKLFKPGSHKKQNKKEKKSQFRDTN